MKGTWTTEFIESDGVMMHHFSNGYSLSVHQKTGSYELSKLNNVIDRGILTIKVRDYKDYLQEIAER